MTRPNGHSRSSHARKASYSSPSSSAASRRTQHVASASKPGLVGRVDVGAAEHVAVVGGVDHGVRERPAPLELLLVPAEVDQVLLEREAGRAVADRLEVGDDVADGEHPQAEALGLEPVGHREVVRDELGSKELVAGGEPGRRCGRGRASSRSARAGCAGGSRAGAGTARRRPRSCRSPRRARPRASRGRPGRRRSARRSRAGARGRSARARPRRPRAASSASRAIGVVIAPAWRTSATSRTRRRIRFAIRGVPRERPAISSAASSSISTPRMRAERRTIVASSAGS